MYPSAPVKRMKIVRVYSCAGGRRKDAVVNRWRHEEVVEPRVTGGGGGVGVERAIKAVCDGKNGSHLMPTSLANLNAIGGLK